MVRRVVLQGICPIMFDRYPGDNDTKLTPYGTLGSDIATTHSS